MCGGDLKTKLPIDDSIYVLLQRNSIDHSPLSRLLCLMCQSLVAHPPTSIISITTYPQFPLNTMGRFLAHLVCNINCCQYSIYEFSSVSPDAIGELFLHWHTEEVDQVELDPSIHPPSTIHPQGTWRALEAFCIFIG